MATFNADPDPKDFDVVDWARRLYLGAKPAVKTPESLSREFGVPLCNIRWSDTNDCWEIYLCAGYWYTEQQYRYHLAAN